MKKKTYLAKYETTVLPRNSSKSEVEKAKKTAAQLKDFLKDAALDYFKKSEGIDLVKETKRSKYDSKIKFQMNAAPSGNVVINIVHYDKDSQKVKAEQVYHVSKDRLFAA